MFSVMVMISILVNFRIGIVHLPVVTVKILSFLFPVLQCDDWCNGSCAVINPVAFTVTQCVTQMLSEISLCDYFIICSHE
jgi:hypothetical protein